MSDSLLRKAVGAAKKILGINGIERNFNEAVPMGKDAKKRLTKEDFVVAGLHYHKTAVRSLSRANPEWRKISPPEDGCKKIYRYRYINKPIELVPEPTNKHDSNAIKVLINGHHVGYIGASDNCHVNDILRSRDIKYTSAYVRGGEYALVYSNGDIIYNSTGVHISIRIAYV